MSKFIGWNWLRQLFTCASAPAVARTIKPKAPQAKAFLITGSVSSRHTHTTYGDVGRRSQPAADLSAIWVDCDGALFPLAREFGELLAHGFDLALELADLFGGLGLRRAVGGPRRLFAGGALGARHSDAEGRKHFHRAFEHREILPCHHFESLTAAAERFRHAVLDGFLVLREALHRKIEIAGHEGLQAVAVKADQLAQETDGQKVLTLRFFFENDLCEDGSRDVF